MSRSFRNTRPPETNERGIALLTVLVALMMISLMLFEFQHNSMVERKLAVNELNQTQAYYLAKSGVRMGLLRVSLYGRLQTAAKDLGKNIPVDRYLNMIWQIPLPPFPPEESSLGKLLKSDKDAAQTALAQTRITDGQYSHTLATESNKINLNFLVDKRQNKSEPINFENCNDLFCLTGATLVNLIDGFIKESEDPFEEFGNVRPDELVFNIMDWVNSGNESYNAGNKDDFYTQQNPPYRAKRNRFYTVDELRLVKGINEALFRKLRPHVTVYSYDGRINVNTMSKAVIQALDINLTEYDVQKIMEYRDEQGGFSTPAEFVSFVSSTLGRGNFSQKFQNPEQYFTVGGQSFVIEALGTVKKSASQVQRSIQVAVALTTASRGGQRVPNANTEAECKKVQGAFWHPGGLNACYYTPTTAQECTANLTGAWQAHNGQDCCFLKNVPICPAGTGTSDPDAKPVQALPNAVKILHWAEG